MKKTILIFAMILICGVTFSQESYHAHVENYEITSVEVVTDSFVQANPTRYTGQWIKIGQGSRMPYCGKGYVYIAEHDTIIIPRSYPDWILSKKLDWIKPTLINRLFNAN